MVVHSGRLKQDPRPKESTPDACLWEVGHPQGTSGPWSVTSSATPGLDEGTEAYMSQQEVVLTLGAQQMEALG